MGQGLALNLSKTKAMILFQEAFTSFPVSFHPILAYIGERPGNKATYMCCIFYQVPWGHHIEQPKMELSCFLYLLKS